MSVMNNPFHDPDDRNCGCADCLPWDLQDQADAVIEDWAPQASAPLPEPRKLWLHSGPCIYCVHGPGCVTCDLTEGAQWKAGHTGLVCDTCSEECKRRELAADPYYSGDYVTTFGDDE